MIISVKQIFPKPIVDLPEAEISIEGITAYLSQGENHQIVFMEFREEVNLPEHFHESQWSVVFEGQIDMIIDGVEHRFVKGDRYFIGKGVKHSGRIYPGYADMTFFNQQDRYKVKNK
jgi:quercetin dioxygenase-like cupin family protein